MKKHKQPVLHFPGLIGTDLSNFRVELIKEETKELEAAIEAKDIYLIADALGDLLYVTFGAAITYGLPIDSIFDEIHRSNMTKEGKMVDNELKVGKGVLYSAPKIRLLVDQCIRMSMNEHDNNNSKR